jgi:SAM-dependent methyltransferase
VSSYSFLAHHYDSLTEDVDYEAWADYYEAMFGREGVSVRELLDLGCGTGSLSCIMARRGYSVTGVDSSEDMLSIAAEKAYELTCSAPLLLCQPMSELDLYGTVEAAVSSLDCLNYVTSAADMMEIFRRVFMFLSPGGIFVFDVLSPEKLKSLDGQVFLDENDEVFCVWRARYDEVTRICSYAMDIFERAGKLWRRGQEEHKEKAWEVSELIDMLDSAGFSGLEVFGELSFEPPSPGEQRIFIKARKE